MPSVFAAFYVLSPKVSLCSGFKVARVLGVFRIGFVCVLGDPGSLYAFCALPILI